VERRLEELAEERKLMARRLADLKTRIAEAGKSK
jgi:hypothetical protein